MPNILEHLRRRTAEPPLLKLPVQETPSSPSYDATKWASDILKGLGGIKDKKPVSDAIGTFVIDLSRIDGIHAVTIRAFEQNTSRPYLSLTAFLDHNSENQDPFKAFLKNHGELARKIGTHVGTGSRIRPVGTEDVNEVLKRFITPIKRAEGKVLGAVHFQRS